MIWGGFSVCTIKCHNWCEGCALCVCTRGLPRPGPLLPLACGGEPQAWPCLSPSLQPSLAGGLMLPPAPGCGGSPQSLLGALGGARGVVPWWAHIQPVAPCSAKSGRGPTRAQLQRSHTRQDSPGAGWDLLSPSWAAGPCHHLREGSGRSCRPLAPQPSRCVGADWGSWPGKAGVLSRHWAALTPHCTAPFPSCLN